MPSLTVFGFGSFFRPQGHKPRDVDLLLIHDDCSRRSIEFAISCKALIRQELPNADIVMLSTTEELDLKFVERSKAVRLSVVSNPDHLQDIYRAIGARLSSADAETISEPLGAIE